MRLAQIARELKTSPNQIVKHLEKNRGLSIDKGLNEKLEDNILADLRDTFKIEEELEPAQEDWSVIEKKEEVVEEQVESLAELEESKDSEELIPENAEYIKVDIPDLEGITVVGKIDLPEPKVVEVEEAPETEEGSKETEVELKSTKREPKPKREVRKRPVRKVLSEEEKEAKAEKRRQQDRERSEKKKKEARGMNYLNSVEQKSPKSKRTKKFSSAQANQVEAPLSALKSVDGVSSQNHSIEQKNEGFLKRAFRWLYHGK